MPPFDDELYPSLGVSTKKVDDSERRSVIHVGPDSIGAAVGFELGDVMLALNGADLPDKESFNRLMAGLRWGDVALFDVRRGDETVRLTAELRRQAPQPCTDE
jgi:S1-C subfamily serine protease